ncbi:MAG TPA: hydrogenase maturation protease [Anaerolineales bacterium]
MLTEFQSNSDTLPSFCHARVLVLGVGNILFGDDGFGPEVIDYLARHFVSRTDVCAMDVGTGARKVLFTVALSEVRPEELLIVDAVDWGRKIGEVLEIPADALPVTKVDDFSLHQVPTSNLLRELQESCGLKVSILACDVGEIAQVIQPGLSPAIETAVVEAAGMIAARYSLPPY